MTLQTPNPFPSLGNTHSAQVVLEIDEKCVTNECYDGKNTFNQLFNKSSLSVPNDSGSGQHKWSAWLLEPRRAENTENVSGSTDNGGLSIRMESGMNEVQLPGLNIFH